MARCGPRHELVATELDAVALPDFDIGVGDTRGRADDYLGSELVSKTTRGRYVVGVNMGLERVAKHEIELAEQSPVSIELLVHRVDENRFSR